MDVNHIVIGGRYLWNMFGRGWIVRITGKVTGGWTAVEEETDFPIHLLSEHYLVRVLADRPPVRPLQWTWPYGLGSGQKLTNRQIEDSWKAFRPHAVVPVVGAEYLMSKRSLADANASHPTYGLVEVTSATAKGVAWDGMIVPLSASAQAKPREVLGFAASMLHERAYKTLAEKRRAVGGL